MAKIDWKSRIEQAIAAAPQPIEAHTYRAKKWDTASRPVVLACDDGNDYVVKGMNAGRMTVNDQIVGLLGAAINAPVPTVKLVRVPAELVAIEPEISHISPGVAHGSLLIPNCSERAWVANIDVATNRPRFAALAVLYGWVGANDHQLIYQAVSPETVYSVDHGHFFPGGPNWTTATLNVANAAQPYGPLLAECKLTSDEITVAVESLALVTNDTIANAVAMPHSTWNLSLDERIGMAEYLESRRTQIISSSY